MAVSEVAVVITQREIWLNAGFASLSSLCLGLETFLILVDRKYILFLNKQELPESVLLCHMLLYISRRLIY